jgi:type IV secretion system protein VirD4
MRSRGVSVSIILQNLAQLKALFEKQWESIVGNCDEFLYLGGNEQSTHKYVSELLGKETLDHNTFGRNKGRNANYSINYQISGRELLTADEVRMLDNRYAILFIRGERPVLDDKYDILLHPNVDATTDGTGIVYDHSVDNRSSGSVELVGHRYLPHDEEADSIEESKYALYSEMDIEQLLDDKENSNVQNNQYDEKVYPIKRKPKPTDDKEPVSPERRARKSR